MLVESQLPNKGITADWYEGELVPMQMLYIKEGIEAVAKYLTSNPIRTYEERKEALLEQSRDNPKNQARIEQEYAISKQNSHTVKRLNIRVMFLNLSANQGTLTENLYNWYALQLAEISFQ